MKCILNECYIIHKSNLGIQSNVIQCKKFSNYYFVIWNKIFSFIFQAAFSIFFIQEIWISSSSNCRRQSLCRVYDAKKIKPTKSVPFLGFKDLGGKCSIRRASRLKKLVNERKTFPLLGDYWILFLCFILYFLQKQKSQYDRTLI